MTFQVCVGAFKVIVPTTSAAVKLYDQFLATGPEDPVYVTTMGGEEVNIDRLRTELDSEARALAIGFGGRIENRCQR